MPQEIATILVQILPLVLIFVVFYFLLIRPQRKKDKEVKNMLANLKVGDRITTIGGFYATIAAIKDGSLHVFDTSKFTVTGDNYELTNTQKCKIVTDDEGHVTSAMMVDTDKDWVADSEEGIADGYYHESSYQSAPSFQIRIDGITELN